MLLAYDALAEVERIDGLLRDYDAVLAAVRPRMDAGDLDRDYSDALARLRYDPDAIRLADFPQEELDKAAQAIMAGIKWRKTNAPVS